MKSFFTKFFNQTAKRKISSYTFYKYTVLFSFLFLWNLIYPKGYFHWDNLVTCFNCQHEYIWIIALVISISIFSVLRAFFGENVLLWLICSSVPRLPWERFRYFWMSRIYGNFNRKGRRNSELNVLSMYKTFMN